MDLSYRTLAHQAADALREQLTSGTWGPGQRLTELTLVDLFGTSRGTVRAALQQLAAEGLVRQRPYAGWEVATIDSTTMLELFSLRASLDGLGARLAAGRISPPAAARLTTTLDRLVRACERDRLVEASEADLALHRVIIEISGHRQLAAHYRLIEHQLRLAVVKVNSLSTVAELVAQHRPLVDAILAGNQAAAEELAAAHDHEAAERLDERLELQ